jgi:hypothetical protein
VNDQTYKNQTYKIQDKEEIKESVKKVVSTSLNSAKVLKTGIVIPECDVFALSYLLGDVAEARGAAAVLSKMFDDKETRKIWKDAVDAHKSGYKSRDRFIEKCICKKRTEE